MFPPYVELSVIGKQQ